MRTHRISSLIVLGLLAMPSLLLAAKPAKEYLVYAGTYTQKDSKGIYAWRFDASTGKATALGLVAETINPSFLALHPNGKFLYAVNEVGDFQGQSSGAVSSYSIDRATGKLTFLNQVPTKGADPCHLILDKTGKHVFVANYTGGNVAVLPIEKDGRLKEASSFIQHTGVVVDAKRQGAPHAHSINLSPDEKFAFVADLGLDRIFSYRFDGVKGTLSPNEVPFTRVAPVAGPRHFSFHPNGKFAYVINEIASSVTAFSYDAQRGVLLERQSVSTLPEDFKGENDCAEVLVHPNGKFLYGSNRGQDSIAVFSIDAKGLLKRIENIPTGGKTPRNFALDPSGSFLFAENQASNNVIVFRVDVKTGHLTPTGETLQVTSPVCVRFLAVK